MLSEISRMPKTQYEQRYIGTTNTACLLSTFVRYMATKRKDGDDTMVLFLGICRVISDGEFDENLVDEAIQLNAAARRRVSGPNNRPLPLDPKKLKGVGETPYLRELYRSYKKATAYGFPQGQQVVDFVTWMREAGVDASAFK